jgi:uncharacterized protein YjiS (DUF1127 family)
LRNFEERQVTIDRQPKPARGAQAKSEFDRNTFGTVKGRVINMTPIGTGPGYGESRPQIPTKEKTMTQILLAIGKTERANPFANLATKFRHGLRTRRTIRELEELDDRLLKDIGITRGDIYALKNGTR